MLEGVAVNVTEVPEQIVLPGLGDKLTEGVRFGFTVTFIGADEAVGELKQVPPAIVISQVTTSAFTNVDVV